MTDQFLMGECTPRAEWSREREKPSRGKNEQKNLVDKVALQKEIGFFSCVGIIIGTVIGSGIFISPKGVLLGCGSVGLTLAVWVLCGILSLVGALSFAELASLIPSSGGQYMYMLEAFAPERKEKKTFWGPLVPFLYNFKGAFFGKPAALAVQCMACASYLEKMSSVACVSGGSTHDSDANLQSKLLSVAILVVVTTINCLSVKVSTKVINFFMVLKVAALVVIIVGGTYKLTQGMNSVLHTGFEDSSFDDIALGIYSGLWAYGGWDNISLVAREIKHPKKNILWSLIVSCSLITIIYLLTNVSYFVLMTKEQFLSSNAVAVDFGTELFGQVGGFLMVFCVASSILGSTIGLSMSSIRMTYAAAREGHLMDFLSFLSIHYKTPSTALIFTSILSVVMITYSDILSLIFAVGYLESFFLALTMVALFVFRRTKKYEPRAIKVNLALPAVSFVFYTFLVVTPIIKNPKLEQLYAVVLLVLGVGFYIPFVYYEVRISKLDNAKKVLQILFEVSPPEDSEI